MAHYARINSNNIVTYVTPIPNEMITDINGNEHEDWAYKHLYETIPDSLEDRWVKTSYNNNFRVRYAGIGYTYNETLDAFIPPKPFASWVLNETTADWESPVGPAPTLTQAEIDSRSFYRWDEDNGEWVLETPPASPAE